MPSADGVSEHREHHTQIARAQEKRHCASLVIALPNALAERLEFENQGLLVRAVFRERHLFLYSSTLRRGFRAREAPALAVVLAAAPTVTLSDGLSPEPREFALEFPETEGAAALAVLRAATATVTVAAGPGRTFALAFSEREGPE